MTITLPANSERTEIISGKGFGCISCTAPFNLKVDREDVRPIVAGRAFFGNRFRRLVFLNTSAAENVIVYEAGEKAIEVQAPAIVTSVASTVEGSTTTKGRGSSTAGSYTSSGTLSGKTRKQIVITNAATVASGLVVSYTDTDGNLMGYVFPQNAITLMTDGVVKIVNAGGAEFVIGETFNV